MSDQTPNRTIGGLPPRNGAPDLSRLQRRNRPSTGPAFESVLADSPADRPSDPSIEPVPAEPKEINRVDLPNQEKTPPPALPAVTAIEKARLTIYLPKNLNHRARAAYRATNHLENDGSWSDFVEHAIEAEVRRRELLYNKGNIYDPDLSPLAAGRPFHS